MNRKWLLALLLIALLLVVVSVALAEQRSGICGENVTWVLDDDGTLTISGEGKMDDAVDYMYYIEKPWNARCEEDDDAIKRVVIEPGVTSIGNQCFWRCTQLTSVEIADTVTELGADAFYRCTSLTEIYIPDGVTVIGNRCFGQCVSLREVRLPGSIQTLPASCFENCQSLTDVQMAEGLNEIGEYCFTDCSGLREVEIPDSVSKIDKEAFERSGLKRVVLPASLTYKGTYIFRDCVYLEEVIFPSSMEYISSGIFAGCVNLKSVLLPDAVKDASGCSNMDFVYVNRGTQAEATAKENHLRFRYLGENQLQYRYNQVMNPDGTAGAQYALIYALDPDITGLQIPEDLDCENLGFIYGAEKLTNIGLPRSITGFGGTYCPFRYCSGLRHLQIPKNVDHFVNTNDSFRYCQSLESLSIEEGNTGIQYLRCMAPSLKKVFLPLSMTSLPDRAVFTSGAVIYCYEYSAAEAWARQYGYSVVLLDGTEDEWELSVPDNMELPVGVSTRIVADGFPYLPDKPITWQTSDPEIAAVSETGEVTLLRSGQAVITVTCDGKTAQTTVKGYCPAERIIAPEATSVVVQGGMLTWPVSVEPFGAKISLVYSHTADCIEISDEDGCLVTGKTAGEDVLSVYDTITGSIRVMKVIVLAETAEYTLERGEGINLQEELFSELEWQTVVWNVSANTPNIVSIDEDGRVEALRRGQAYVYGTLNEGGTVMVTVNVTGSVSRILLPEEIYVVVNQSEQVEYGCDPEDETISEEWSIANTAVATVDANGLVTANAVGDTTLTLRDSGTSVSATTVVHSCYPVTGVAFDEEEVTITVGSVQQLTAQVSMRTQSCVNHLVTFSSSDDSVARVSATGTVTALTEGTAVITATADSGVSASCRIEVTGCTIQLPAGIREIREEICAGTAGEVYIIPEGAESIGEKAFAGLKRTAVVKIPESVTDIAENAFEGSDVIIECAAGSAAEEWAEAHEVDVRLR